ncbi:amidohydrolase family protein [Novosphingobium sp. G106]|uniref:N-acyl-D-amino-acid deacylase family protein n=1 Tax=Novosphingobium sp. G106 TaxID=2849500 RepID=UPI001C2CFBDF|nr:amidohydrolase family protein [Novosphingobium sp. G106]MBV1689361.1 amidohydrolase family protein [Novosphingobium sp. G106]
MLDLRIVGGTIVDGTGRPGFRGDLGIKDGRIVAVGSVEEPALETIDAAGKIVAPGFIDVHTHYDAQAFWDPTLSPSCFHGVTTVMGGFCGFSIAPLTAESASYIKPMLARVEGMPLETLEAAVPWDWASFGEFLARLDGRIGLNAGFYVGHSAIRRIVMGERAVGETAQPADVEAMKVLLDQSLAEGALGFSTTVSPGHVDGDNRPVPSRWAEPSEMIELARVVARHEGTGLELLPDIEFGPGMAELMADFSVAGQRPVNWNLVVITGRPDTESRAMHQLAASDVARARGGEVIALAVPSTPYAHMSFRSPSAFSGLPGVWAEMFTWPAAERTARLADPAVRAQMIEDAAKVKGQGMALEFKVQFGDFKIIATRAGANAGYKDRLVRDIAAERGVAPLDALLDIVVADGLDTIFAPELGGEDAAGYALRGRLWDDDRVLIGASDAGAHLDVIDTFAFSTTVLEKGVRKYGVISLEAAIHKMTQRPAAYFGLVDRGTIASGNHADIVVFDQTTVGRGATYLKYDLPGDAESYRIYADAFGIAHVLVNGVEIVRDGAHTGKLPGTVLRSGRDTRTVAMDVMRQPTIA